jgi:acetyltransferase-like isoleucine patch superfamily enzyme
MVNCTVFIKNNFKSKIMNIYAKNLKIGKNVFIHSSASIRGVSGKANEITIGDNVYIGENVQIICDVFSIGDYSKIQHHTNIHGYNSCVIGNNAWIGQYTIIDCIGGMFIGHNCGIGAHSQLWSHIKFGDTLEGCRFLSEKEMNIGNDVWFVGHCIVSPIIAEDKSLALAGSVVTRDMRYNEIYAGSPAKSISDKVGFQFIEKSIDEKFILMFNYLKEFQNSIKANANIKIVRDISEVNFYDGNSYFDVSTRKYKKQSTDVEIEFMKYLLPAKAKFIPFQNDTI